MKLSDFDYNLPKELIAQVPIKPRDHSRLLILEKETGKITDKNFYDIIDYLQYGDLLVLNNTKVFPARLIGRKNATGGKIEIFLLKKNLTPTLSLSRRGRNEVWQCLIGGHGRKENLIVEFDNKLQAEVIKDNADGTWTVKFNRTGKALMEIVYKIGITPLPPYIKRRSHIVNRVSRDTENYQTVYADNHKVGSVAAPTAGLHFTPQLIRKLQAKGVEIAYITLHVGLGTFAPVKIDNITKHKLHSEWVEVNTATIKKIHQAKIEKRRVIAVGTTSVRTLEAMASEKLKNGNKKLFRNLKSELRNYSGWTDIFIYPGYKFKIVDAMITNFHLPKSTLLMLVSALAGKKNIDKAYEHAIKTGYRFYSYGDAMFIK